jgi:hypothetical protein
MPFPLKRATPPPTLQKFLLNERLGSDQKNGVANSFPPYGHKFEPTCNLRSLPSSKKENTIHGDARVVGAKPFAGPEYSGGI